MRIEMRSFAKRIVIEQKKKKRNQKTRQQYKTRALQKANPEQTAEKTARKVTSCNNSTVNTSLLPTAPHQAAKHSDREPASHRSSSEIHGCNSFRLRFLKKSYHCTALASLLASLPGYIGYAEEMEATGQGQVQGVHRWRMAPGSCVGDTQDWTTESLPWSRSRKASPTKSDFGPAKPRTWCQSTGFHQISSPLLHQVAAGE